MVTRAFLLQSAGHRVIRAMSEPELLSACRNHKVDVVVIGQSVAKHPKCRIFELVKQHCPTAKVLELCDRFKEKEIPEADDWLETPTTVPNELATRVSSLASKTST